MSFFKNLSTAKAFTQNKWFTPGRYLVRIMDVRFNAGGFKGDSFVIEATVLAAENDAEDKEAPKKGDSCAHVWNASGAKQEIARNTWMSFLCAVFGCRSDEKTDKEWEEISAQVIDENALDGQIMVLEVWNKPTKAGEPFTYHGWRRVARDEDFLSFGLENPK